MKILLLCFVGLLALVGLIALVVVCFIVGACATYQEQCSDWMRPNDYPQTCPEILPRKTGHPLSRDQKLFTSGFALGALASVAGAWIILKISL